MPSQTSTHQMPVALLPQILTMKIDARRGQMSPWGQNQALDEKHCFQEIPLAVIIVFVCFLMFYQGRPSVSLPTPNMHEHEHTGTCLCRHYMCLELGYNSMLNGGHQFGSSRSLKSTYQYHNKNPVCTQAVSSSPAETFISVCSQLLKSFFS